MFGENAPSLMGGGGTILHIPQSQSLQTLPILQLLRSFYIPKMYSA